MNVRIDRGALLIASPNIDSGLLFRSVILLCDHSAAGSFGLILNKPLSTGLPEDLLQLEEIENPNVALRVSGVAQQSQVMILHSYEGSDQSLKICEGVYLGGDLTLFQMLAHDPGQPSLCLCFGYSGWGPDQLEREFLAGNWFLHPGSKALVFDTPAPLLWQTVLKEMGGKFASLSTMPEDLSLN
jgi:putative transcriptional regulator